MPTPIPDDLFTPAKNRSAVWLHFKLSNTDKAHAFCCVDGCLASRRAVKRVDASTSSLQEHLRLYHRHLLRSDASSSSSSSSSIRHLLKAASVTPCSVSFQRELDGLITQMVIANCLPLRIVDSPELITAFHFATGRSYLPISRTKLTDSLDTLYHSMVDTMLFDMKDNTISLTSDAATLDNGGSYITVTAHYINSQWQLRDVAVLVCRMNGSHTGEYVRDLLDMAVQTWEAEGRVFAAVTDNGANFVKGARISQHVKDELRCAVHTMQLALKDGVAGQPDLQQLCRDAQELVVSVRRSSALSEELQSLQRDDIAAAAVVGPDDDGGEEACRPLKLAMNVVTRFNSLCILFTRLLDVKPALQRLCLSRASDLDGKALSANQWEQVAELVSVLRPVKETCDHLEASTTPSLSLLLPLVCNVLHILYEVHGTLKIASCRNVCAAVRSSIYDRMLDALTDKTVRVAMALDPRVRTKQLPNYDKTHTVSALRECYQDFAATFAQFRGDAASLRAAAPEVVIDEKEEKVEPPPPKRHKSVLDLVDDSVAAGPVSELDEFSKEAGIEMSKCPLQWWAAHAARYPVLAQMARVYLAVPASSAPSERVFSVASLVLTDRRRRLDESRVARLVFLKRNMALYQALSGKQYRN